MLEDIHEEIAKKALEGDDFYITLLAKQAALQKAPGSSGTAVFGLSVVAEAIANGAKESLRSLAAAAVSEMRGENVFDEDVGDTYMLDVDVSSRPFMPSKEQEENFNSARYSAPDELEPSEDEEFEEEEDDWSDDEDTE